MCFQLTIFKCSKAVSLYFVTESLRTSMHDSIHAIFVFVGDRSTCVHQLPQYFAMSLRRRKMHGFHLRRLSIFRVLQSHHHTTTKDGRA